MNAFVMDGTAADAVAAGVDEAYVATESGAAGGCDAIDAILVAGVNRRLKPLSRPPSSLSQAAA
jgi:hypothetical protein